MSTLTQSAVDKEVKIPQRALSGEDALQPHGQISPDALDIDNAYSKSYLDELNWLNQEVEVTLNPSSVPGDATRRVVIGINGREYPFLRGMPKKVPRFVLAHIASSKRETLTFGTRKDNFGEAVNLTDQVAYLKHPHTYTSLVSSTEDRAREAQWYNNCLNQHF